MAIRADVSVTRQDHVIVQFAGIQSDEVAEISIAECREVLRLCSAPITGASQNFRAVHFVRGSQEVMEYFIQTQERQRSSFKCRNCHRKFLAVIPRPYPERQADLFQIAYAVDSDTRSSAAMKGNHRQ